MPLLQVLDRLLLSSLDRRTGVALRDEHVRAMEAVREVRLHLPIPERRPVRRDGRFAPWVTYVTMHG